jgi:hypothetical protein
VNVPAGIDASLPQRFDEALVIRAIQEDQLTAVRAIHDVINRAGYSTLNLRDMPGECPAPLNVNIKTLYIKS